MKIEVDIDDSVAERLRAAGDREWRSLTDQCRMVLSTWSDGRGGVAIVLGRRTIADAVGLPPEPQALPGLDDVAVPAEPPVGRKPAGLTGEARALAAYKYVAKNGGWDRVAEKYGYPSTNAATIAVKYWARRNDLRWPLIYTARRRVSR